jgi:hypothetical protein
VPSLQVELDPVGVDATLSGCECDVAFGDQQVLVLIDIHVVGEEANPLLPRNRHVDGSVGTSNEPDVVAVAEHFSEANVELLEQIFGLRGWRSRLRGRRISLLRERGCCCADAGDAEEDGNPDHECGTARRFSASRTAPARKIDPRHTHERRSIERGGNSGLRIGNGGDGDVRPSSVCRSTMRRRARLSGVARGDGARVAITADVTGSRAARI